MKIKINSYKHFPPAKGVLFLSIIACHQATWALASLEDSELSSVSGQSGLVINLESKNAGVSIDELTQTVDSKSMTMKAVSLIGKSNINSATTGDAPVRFINTLDVGSTAAGSPAVAYHLKLDSAARLQIEDVTLGSSSRSFGTMALEGASAQLKLTSAGGLLNATNVGGTYLFGEIVNASMYYRQLAGNTSPYLIMDDLNLHWEIPKATLGVVSTSPDGPGLLMATLDKTVNPSVSLADSLLSLELGYDLKYRNPAQDGGAAGFVRGDSKAAPLMNFAWKGSVKDARLFWAGGGAWGATGNWSNPAANTTQGLRLSSRWNYVNTAEAMALGDAEKDFRWRFGEAGGAKLSIELSDWNNMPGVQYAHSFPMIAMDVIGPNEGPGGTASSLCWGAAGSVGTGACSGSNGQSVKLQAGQVRSFLPGGTNYDAYALMVRGANLLSYSNKVKLVEGTTIRATKDWGLIYTLANLDGNIFFYPGGNPGDTNKGIVADIALMSQTLDGGVQVSQPWSKDITSGSHNSRWNRGTHLMIADTTACSSVTNPVSCGIGETGMGIGLIGSSILIMANDTRLWVKPYTNSYYEGGIDLLSPQMRYEVKGTFGGGTIPNGRQIVTGGLVGINAEGLLNLRFSPAPPEEASSFLGYSMAARIYKIDDGNLYTQDSNVIASGKGSFVSFAEQNRPDKPLLLGGISGDFAITNGKVNLVNSTETEGAGMNDGYYKLRISNDILFGTQANARLLEGTGGGSFLPGGTTAQPFRINDVTFGGDKLGSIVIPSGQWAYSLTLRPQCTGNSAC